MYLEIKHLVVNYTCINQNQVVSNKFLEFATTNLLVFFLERERDVLKLPVTPQLSVCFSLECFPAAFCALKAKHIARLLTLWLKAYANDHYHKTAGFIGHN